MTNEKAKQNQEPAKQRRHKRRISEHTKNKFKLRQGQPAEQSELEEDATMMECWLVHPIDDDDCEQCPSVNDCREVRESYESMQRRAEAAEKENKRLTLENEELKKSVDNLQKEIKPEIIEQFLYQWEIHPVRQPTDSTFNLALRIIDSMKKEIERLKGFNEERENLKRHGIEYKD